MSAEKIVVLNSGGFDSSVLIHYVRDEHEDAEIHSLFFEHGQRSLPMEKKWSEYNANRVGAIHHAIPIAKFRWTQGEFYNEGWDFKTQYLEWRNLVFLSYALSFASSIGARKIYLATLKSADYNDTSERFLEIMNKLDDNIEIIAPFGKFESKLQFASWAFLYGIEPNTYWSCDNPKVKISDYGEKLYEVCGVCNDCRDVIEIGEMLKLDTPINLYRRYHSTDCNGFLRGTLKLKPWELRILWNNDCQLSCKHCFYGFKELHAPRLSLEEFLRVTDEAVESFGITSIHIGGKEPLYEDSVLSYIKAVRSKYHNMLISVVTNGIRLPALAENLKNAGLSEVCLSVDGVWDNDRLIRTTSLDMVEKAVHACNACGLKVNIFIDLHRKNFDTVTKTIRYFEDKFGIQNFHIANIKISKTARENGVEHLIPSEFKVFWDSLVSYKALHKETKIEYGMGLYYVTMAQRNFVDIDDTLNNILHSVNYWVSENAYVIPEFFCNSYLQQITVTPDGYVLGCGIEVADPEYWNEEKHAGNVRDSSLEELLKRGKINKNWTCNGILNKHRFEGCIYEFEDSHPCIL